MDIKIPKSFQLHGKTINVILDKDLLEKESNIDAQTNYLKCKIFLQDYNKNNVNKDYQNQIFLHEVVHFILFHMQEEELKNNEKFVNLFSELLYQFLITMK